MRGLLVLLIALFTGCQQEEIFSEIDEGQANDITALLREHGVSAKKSRMDKGQWSVVVPDSEFSKAVSLARAYNYPRATHRKSSDLYGEKGLVSTRMEEQVRYIIGVEEDLSESISLIDGVTACRVHLTMPENERRLGDTSPQFQASASVFIECVAGSIVEVSRDKIKELVSNSVRGLETENVAVVVFAADPVGSALPVYSK